MGQLKLLDGQVDLKGETDSIVKWLKKNEPSLLKEAFFYIHSQRGKKQFPGSPLAFAFLDAMPNQPYEETL